MTSGWKITDEEATAIEAERKKFDLECDRARREKIKRTIEALLEEGPPPDEGNDDNWRSLSGGFFQVEIEDSVPDFIKQLFDPPEKKK